MPYFDRVISDDGHRLRTLFYLSFTDTAIHTYLKGTRMIFFIRTSETLKGNSAAQVAF